LVAPEVAHGQAGERDMRVKPRNKDISGDRVLVVKVGESVREKLCTEEILERSHWQRPIPFPGKSRRPARVRESRHHDRRALELSARMSGRVGDDGGLPRKRRFRKPDPTWPPARAGRAVPAQHQLETDLAISPGRFRLSVEQEGSTRADEGRRLRRYLPLVVVRYLTTAPATATLPRWLGLPVLRV
jgi:hypothetical protein